MNSSPRFIALCSLLLLCLAGPAAAQYMKLVSDNPTDNTKMRASGTTVLTFMLDSNHDRNGSLQTCNSHTAALGCGTATANPLDVGSFTLTLTAVGGTVTWGSFTTAGATTSAAYADLNGGVVISSSTQIEVDYGRASGFDTPGLYTMGSIPVTPTSGTPSIVISFGQQPVNPSGFGTGFGTECDASTFPNTYVLGDPANLCGSFGDFSDVDGVGAAANNPPTLNPIANMNVAEGATANQVISGSDPDGDALTFSKVSGPTFMTVSTTNATTGNIHLTPGFADAGAYNATARASDGVASADRGFSILVCNGGCEGTPVLAQPTNMTVAAGATKDQAISGSDPSAQPLTFSKLAGPVWMTVTTTSPTTGNIHLAPPLGTSGTFVGTVSASNGATTDSKSFTITVNNTCTPPVLSQPANMLVPEGGTADQTLNGTSPDGNPLTFAKVAGPTYMTVTTTSPTTGNVHLATGFAEPAGTAAATVSATDGICGTDSKSFTIVVCLGCQRPPVLNAIADMTVTEGGTANQTITATDADGNALEFSKTLGPVFMTVTTVSPGTGIASGNIHLAPGLSYAGTYSGTVSVSDGSSSASRVFSITVQTSGNRCPTANPGGPYVGLAGVPITFNGSASSDPDGNPLTYAWDFDASDGIQVDAVGVIATHTYAVDGPYVATLTVTDNGDGDPAQVCSDRRGTSVQVNPACQATIMNGYDTIRLGSGKPLWFAYVQPGSDCYVNTDVVTSSFVMRYAGRQIPAEATKTTIGGDKNGDGIQEIKVNWTKENLRALFSGTGLANGHNNVTVTIEADLVSVGKLRGTTQLDVVNNGSFTIAAVAPNPLNPEATLTYTTTRQGPVRIDMFDIQGRLVRRLVDAAAMTAGVHDVTIDGRGERGEKLPSGVYYIRGTSSEGAFKQLVTILK